MRAGPRLQGREVSSGRSRISRENYESASGGSSRRMSRHDDRDKPVKGFFRQLRRHYDRDKPVKGFFRQLSRHDDRDKPVKGFIRQLSRRYDLDNKELEDVGGYVGAGSSDVNIPLTFAWHITCNIVAILTPRVGLCSRI